MGLERHIKIRALKLFVKCLNQLDCLYSSGKFYIKINREKTFEKENDLGIIYDLTNFGSKHIK